MLEEDVLGVRDGYWDHLCSERGSCSEAVNYPQISAHSSNFISWFFSSALPLVSGVLITGLEDMPKRRAVLGSSPGGWKSQLMFEAEWDVDRATNSCTSHPWHLSVVSCCEEADTGTDTGYDDEEEGKKRRQGKGRREFSRFEPNSVQKKKQKLIHIKNATFWHLEIEMWCHPKWQVTDFFFWDRGLGCWRENKGSVAMG